jgi:choline dehydrogenase-like flavoprotein
MVSNKTSETLPLPPTPNRSMFNRPTCCIVGGGPAGVILALLLARQDIPVMLLESHKILIAIPGRYNSPLRDGDYGGTGFS